MEDYERMRVILELERDIDLRKLKEQKLPIEEWKQRYQTIWSEYARKTDHEWNLYLEECKKQHRMFNQRMELLKADTRRMENDIVQMIFYGPMNTDCHTDTRWDPWA